MKKCKTIWHNCWTGYIFVAALSVAAGVSTSTKSKVVNLPVPTTDGPNDSTFESTSPATSSSSPTPLPSSVSTEFSSRQGLSRRNDGGFKPSVDFAHFAEKTAAMTSASSITNSSKVNFPGADKKESSELHRIPPALLKLYDNHKEYNSSSTDQVDAKEEIYEKHPRIYYGDVSPAYPAYPNPELNSVGVDVEHHHQNGKFEVGKHTEEEEPKYYYPKNLMSKYYEREHGHGDGHEREHGHDHSHGHGSGLEHGHGYGHEHKHSHHGDHHHEDVHGHGHHGYGYSHPIHEDLHAHVPQSNHYGHSGRHYINKVDALGKALQVLLPSALLLTGVSALFPNRVHVPTTDNNYRQKRSVSYPARNGHFDREPDFEEIPSKYLQREHRNMNNDDVGIELFDIEDGRLDNNTPYLTSVVPLREKSPSPVRTRNNKHNHRNHPREYEEDIRPKKETQIEPQVPSPTPTVASMENMPGEYDAFYFNNPNAYSFDIPVPNLQPKPTLLPPTVPVTAADEVIPLAPNESTEKPAATKSTKARKVTRTRTRFIPIPIEDESILESLLLPSPTESTVIHEIPSSTVPPNISSTVPSTTTENIPLLKIFDENLLKAAAQEAKNIQDHAEVLKSSRLKAKEEDSNIIKKDGKIIDLSPDGPVMGLISSYAAHDSDSPDCQKKALCQLAMHGTSPSATKFEAFLWNLASLVPDQFSELYDLEEIFHAIRRKECRKFLCDAPNLNIQM